MHSLSILFKWFSTPFNQNVAKLTGLIVAMQFIFISGCTVTYKAVGTYDNFNEVLLGTVNADLMTGGGEFEMEGKNTKIRCNGRSNPPHYVPSSLSCAGQRGDGYGKCSDGRRIIFEWVANTCTIILR